MLRIYVLQQRFIQSDPRAEDATYGGQSMRRFARVEPCSLRGDHRRTNRHSFSFLSTRLS